MLQYPFTQHAFEAGTVVAIIAGIVGYFVVLRRSSFAAHALSHIGFAGAAAAVLIGISPVYGLLLFTSVGGLGIAALGRRAAHRDAEIGIVLAFMLGLGVLFLSLHTGYATEAYSILFWRNTGYQFQQCLINPHCWRDNSGSHLACISTSLVCIARPRCGGSKRSTRSFARHNFHAPRRGRNVVRGSSCRCPPHLLVDGHASYNGSAIGKKTEASHNYLRSHCSDSNVAGALYCFF